MAMPFFDRYWWLETLAAIPLLGLAIAFGFYYVDSVYPNEIQFQREFHDSDPTILIIFPALIALFVVFAFVVVGLSFRGQERKRLRRLALAGNLDALPLSRVTADAAKASDVSHEPLIIMWRLKKRSVLAYRALIAFTLLVLLAIAAVFVLLVFVWQPTNPAPGFDTPFPIELLQAGPVVLLALSAVLYLPKAIGASTGITATEDGVRWHTPWLQQRFLRWENVHLFEVLPTGRFCREYILYGERGFVRWQDYIPEFEFSSLGISSKQEYQPDGISADEMGRRTRTMLNLVASRTGLTPRTLHRRLQPVDTARQQRSGVIVARVLFLAMGLILLGIAAAVILFPLVGSNDVFNLLSAISLALLGSFCIVFGLILAPLFARNQERTAVSPADQGPALLDSVPTQPFLRPEDAYVLSFGTPPLLRLILLLVGILLTLGGLPAVPWVVAWVPTIFAPIVSPGSLAADPLSSIGASILAWVLLFISGGGMATVWATLLRFGKTFGLHEVRADASGLHLRIGVSIDLPWDAIETLTLRQRQGQPLGYRVTGNSGKADFTWPARLGRWSRLPKDAIPLSPAALATLVTRQSGAALQTVEEEPRQSRSVRARSDLVSR